MAQQLRAPVGLAEDKSDFQQPRQTTTCNPSAEDPTPLPGFSGTHTHVHHPHTDTRIFTQIKIKLQVDETMNFFLKN